jgi:ATP-dependent RNA helicase RhlE
MPKQMEELSSAYLTGPKRVQVSPPGKAADKIKQSIHFLPKPAKPAKLRQILSQDMDALTLVFSRTKHGAEKMMRQLKADGYNAESIHGNKSQGQRDRAIKAFRAGTVKVLVATDVAARGIDIPGVAYVINYDLPDVPDNYVHRIGRTARAGREGEAIAFCAPEEADLLRQIQKTMKMTIPVASGTPPEAGQGQKPGQKPGRRPNRSRKPGHTNARSGGGGNNGGAPGGNGKPGGSRRRRRPRKAA